MREKPPDKGVKGTAGKTESDIKWERISLGTRDGAGKTLVFKSPDEMHQLDAMREANFLVKFKKRLSKEPKNYKRVPNITFDQIEKLLKENPVVFLSILQMQELGGQPDIIEETEDYYLFADCSAGAPMNRCYLTYDEAVQMAEEEIRFDMADAETYKKLKAVETNGPFFDVTTSSWVLTPEEIRSTGQALYGSSKGMGQCNAMDKDPSRGLRGYKKLPKKR